VRAPNARGRAKLVGRAPAGDPAGAPAKSAAPSQGDPPPAPDRTRRLPWAELPRRVHAVDVLVRDRCGGARKVLAFISDEGVARHILDHLS
jgi:hypothetical protein